ncbi:MAG: hypothetical protein PHD32_00855 [Eubacteriales bacterium]|nr:hypothetical protein [Eubacteriales bacterium]
MKEPEACPRRTREDHPCKDCNEACPMAKAFVSAPADWKVWALMAAGVVLAAALLKLLL